MTLYYSETLCWNETLAWLYIGSSFWITSQLGKHCTSSHNATAFCAPPGYIRTESAEGTTLKIRWRTPPLWKRSTVGISTATGATKNSNLPWIQSTRPGVRSVFSLGSCRALQIFNLQRIGGAGY
jgi:hypothetical protein